MAIYHHEVHQRIARENGEKILAAPQIALDAITKQQSTFTHHDLARFVNRRTVDAEQYAKDDFLYQNYDAVIPSIATTLDSRSS